MVRFVEPATNWASPRPACGERSDLRAAKIRVKGTLRESEYVERAPHPSPLRASFARLDPAKSGARELTVAAAAPCFNHYRFRPSIGVIASFANSTPSMQLTFSATISLPSGLLPRANTSTPQSRQS